MRYRYFFTYGILFFLSILSAKIVFCSDKWNLWSSGTKLRGANIYQRRVYPELDGPTFMGSGKVGPPYRQQDFDSLAAWGANYVNISHPGLFTENPPYTLDSDIQQNLDSLLNMIYRADMFAVISFRTGPGRSEFTFFWGEDNSWFDASYYNDQVWKSQAAQDAWAQMWAYAAQRYKNHPAVVGYDLMVEPNSNDVWLDLWDQEQFYQQYGGTLYDWNQFFPHIITAIRQVDTKTPILVGGMGYSGMDWLPYIVPVSDTRTIYTVHQYAPFVYTHQEPPLNKTYPGFFDTDWDGIKENFNQAWIQNLFATIDDFRTQHDRLVAINEFAAMRWEPGVADFLNDEMNLMEEKGINYALWLWETSWPEYAQEVDAFNFRHGSNPDHHSDVSSSDLINVIKNHWNKNTVRPSNFYGKKYYVSTNGNDNNNGLTPQSAWRTIPHAINQIAPGDTIEILAGSYDSFIVNKSGQNGNRIVIRGVSADQVIVSGIEIAKYVQYVTISDMTVQGFSVWGVFVRGTNRYITFQRLKVFGGDSGIHLTWGYSGQNPEDGPVSNITVEDCIIANCIYTALDGTPGPCDSLVFRNLEVYGAGLVGGDAWGSDGIAIERGDYILVENCYVHDNGGDGIDLCSRNYNGNRQGIIVRGNRVLRNHSNGIKIWAGGRMENNFVAGMGNAAVDIGAMEGNYEVINNTIAWNMRDPSYAVRNYAFVAAYPDDYTGISSTIQLTMLNNIFAFNCSDQLGGQTGIYLGEGVNLINEGYNCFYSREDGEIEAQFLSGDPWITRQQITDGTWHNKTGQGTGDICLDPKFFNPDSFDFRLTQGSPCIDSGNPSPNYYDKDGSRNDLGGYGGPHGESYQYPNPADNFIVSGKVTYYGWSIPVNNVTLSLIENDTIQSTTNQSGDFQFSQVPGGKNYLLVPQKNDPFPASTILSYDASVAARLALNILPDTSICQMLAADCDKNGAVQMFDASLIARYAVGLNNTMGSFVGQWDFNPANRTFVSLSQNQTAADFSAYIIGDTDGSWADANGNSSGEGHVANWIDITQMPNENIRINFLGSDTEKIYSLDLELLYDTHFYQLVEVEKTSLSQDFTLNINDQNNGILRVGAFHYASITGSSPLLRIELHSVQKDSNFAHLAINKYYINQLNVIGKATAVKFRNLSQPHDFFLEQNYPNPFNPVTQISFYLPAKAKVSLEIFNTLGEKIATLADRNFSRGKHFVQFDASNLSNGIYFCRMQAEGVEHVIKMILMR